MEKKHSMGRKKIPIKKIEKKSSLQVTFSKRRTGLFKKAAELSTICGAQVAVLVHSPAKKLFSFGNPSIDSVLQRFIAQIPDSTATPSSSSSSSSQAVAHNDNGVDEGLGFWWENPIDGLGFEELQRYISALEELKNNVLTQADKIAMAGMSPSNFLNLDDFDLMMKTEGSGSARYGDMGFDHNGATTDIKFDVLGAQGIALDSSSWGTNGFYHDMEGTTCDNGAKDINLDGLDHIVLEAQAQGFVFYHGNLEIGGTDCDCAFGGTSFDPNGGATDINLNEFDPIFPGNEVTALDYSFGSTGFDDYGAMGMSLEDLDHDIVATQGTALDYRSEGNTGFDHCGATDFDFGGLWGN